MQVIVVLRGHRTTGVNLDKHLNLIPTPFRSKSPSTVLTTYCDYSFYLLNQPVNFSPKSSQNCLRIFRYSSLCFPSTQYHVQITMDLYPSEIINSRGLGLGLVNLHVSTNPPFSHSKQMLSIDCILIAWSCPPQYHTFLDKDECLHQHQPMICRRLFSKIKSSHRWCGN